MKNFTLILTVLCAMALSVSCNGNQSKSTNPLLSEWDTPFGVPPFDKIQVSDYEPAFMASMKEHNEEIEAIVKDKSDPGFENVILAFDRSGDRLRQISYIFDLLCSANTSPEMQAVEEKMMPLLSAHSDGVMMNEKLFAKIKNVYDNRSGMGLDGLQMRLLEKIYKRFERSGANLQAADKEQLMKINQELSTAMFRFGSNLLAENARYELLISDNELGGLPAGVRNSARNAAREAGEETGTYRFDISTSSMLPFITYSDNRELRQQIYTAYLEKCNYGDEYDNKEIINEIVRLRDEKAALLGYETYADFKLDDVMAKTPANVYSLLDEIWEPALTTAKVELEEMRKIKQRETGSSDFESWDWWYYAEKVRKSKYNLDQEALRPYFSLNTVRTGIFELCNRLYGITFKPVAVPVYHEECFTYEVNDVDGSLLGILYMDFHPRPGNKRSGAWCGDYREQSYKDGKRVAPVVTVVCNFTRPSSQSAPALLTLDETETFFHEFGHALHSLFSDVEYSGLIGVERDFVELPSQIMENWAIEPEMLRSYAVHYTSGNVIPENLIDRILSSRTFNQGFVTTELVAASYTDMDIHTIKDFQPVNVNAFEREMLNEKRGLIDQIAPRYRYPYFNHIFGSDGYSSGYYSYLWAEVLDKDAYEAFVESGDIFDRKVAARFRNEILSKGGTADGMTLYRNFRGQDPSRLPLLRGRGLIE